MRTQVFRNCQECGYSLAGLTGKLCPECGHDQVEGGKRAKRTESLRRFVLSGVAFGSGAFCGWLAVALPVASGIGADRYSRGVGPFFLWAGLLMVLLGGPALTWLRTMAFIVQRAKGSRALLLHDACGGAVWGFAVAGAVVFAAFAGMLMAVWDDRAGVSATAVFGMGLGIAGASGMLRIGGGARSGNNVRRWWLLVTLVIAAPTAVAAYGQVLDESLLRSRYTRLGWPEDLIRRTIAWSRHGYYQGVPKHPASHWIALMPSLMMFRRPLVVGLVWGVAAFMLARFGCPCVGLG